MTIAVGLTVSDVDRGQMSDGSGHNETDRNSLIMYCTTIHNIELECILNNNNSE